MENKEQETVEQAALYKISRITIDNLEQASFIQGATFGANWQKAQGLFTREDMFAVWKEKEDWWDLKIPEGIEESRKEFDEFMSSNYPETK